MISARPKRILHVLGGLIHGGVETWLVHVTRHFDLERFPMDFLVHSDKKGPYDDVVLELGCQVIHCADHRRPWRYARNFRDALASHGPYDVVHSHVHHFSGYVLKLAHQADIRGRIAHSHNAPARQTSAPWLRRMYLHRTERWIRSHATVGLACSRLAARSLYGADWQEDPRWQILHYGIDLDPFQSPLEKAEVRADLGLPDDALVVGHVGSFTEQKNHRFLIEIAETVLKVKPNAHFLLVGDGPLRPAIEQDATRRGIRERIVFAGLRPDVPRLMRGAMDVFLLPSLFEGLPVVVLEAQAAGLPCVLSNVITDEVCAVPEAFTRVALEATASQWCDAVLAQSNGRARVAARGGLDAVKRGDFNIEAGLKRLEQIYEQSVK